MAEAGGLRLEDRVEILNTHNIWVVAGPGRGQQKRGGGKLVEERIQRSNEDLTIEYAFAQQTMPQTALNITS